MNNSELLNAEQLDESVSNLINQNLLDGLTENTSLLNANGDVYSYATAGKDLQTLSGCKKPKPPILGLLTGGISNINYKKRKKAYEDCIKNYKANLEKQKQQVASSAAAQADLAAKLKKAEEELEDAKNQTPDSSRVVEGTGDKFLGMPKAVGITVAVVGGLALVVGGIFLVRKLRK